MIRAVERVVLHAQGERLLVVVVVAMELMALELMAVELMALGPMAEGQLDLDQRPGCVGRSHQRDRHTAKCVWGG